MLRRRPLMLKDFLTTKWQLFEKKRSQPLCNSSQKAQKATKSRAVRGCFLCGNVCLNKFRTQNWGAFLPTKNKMYCRKMLFVDYRRITEC